MNLDIFDHADVALHHNPSADRRGVYPPDLDQVLSAKSCETARAAIAGWPGYRPTPLHALEGLAAELDVAGLYYKDESDRFGLGSFKALGGAYAVLRLLSRELSARTGTAVSDVDIVSGGCAAEAQRVTVVTATDGNHGRSVAWGARQFGCRCFIYMHAGVSKGRASAVEELGATVVWVDGNYDDSVHQAADDAEANGWFVVSDTSWEGYSEMPRHVMAGYTVMTSEITQQLPSNLVPTHMFVQGGCGGLAGAVLNQLWQYYGARCPRFIVVEPDRADCLYKSSQADAPAVVNIVEETIMAGLSCGEVSLLGWQILREGASDFMTISDELVAPVMRLLADGACGDAPVVAGESAVAGLAGLIAALRKPSLSEALALENGSRILVLGTEGATDPAIYRSIVGRSAAEVAGG